MPTMILYGVIALALMGGIGWGYKVVKDSGREEIRLEWAQANEKAKAVTEAERVRQDKVRQQQDEAQTKRLANEKRRVATLMSSLDSHIKVARLPADCKLTDLLLGDANNALAGNQSLSPQPVPAKPGPTPTAR